MRARALLAVAALLLASPAETHAQETPDALPDAPGREETFHTCIACHGTAVIRRSRLSREGWDELMNWMTEKHGMAPLEGEDRRVIVDYLARVFPPTAPQQRGRGANPFLER